MFYLPNNVPIDDDGAIDCILEDADMRCFLDVMTGDIASIESKTKQGKALLRSALEHQSRYVEIPKVSDEQAAGWMEEFIKEVMHEEDEPLSEFVRHLLKKKGFWKAYDFLDARADNWIYEWDAWEDDKTFELLANWLLTLPLAIRYEQRDKQR